MAALKTKGDTVVTPSYGDGILGVTNARVNSGATLNLLDYNFVEIIAISVMPE